jgi:hypothetical protein
MDRPLIIRLAAPMADAAIAAGQAEPVPPSDTRDGALELAVQVSIVAKDVASVVIAVAAGAKGVRAILERMRKEKPEYAVTIAVHADDGERSWSLRMKQADEATLNEISGVVAALEADVDPEGLSAQS